MNKIDHEVRSGRGPSANRTRQVIIAFAASMIVLTPSASAQSALDVGQSIVNALGAAAERSRLRKTVTELSAPLQYEPAAGPVDPTNRADPRNLDVAGVQLGMTPVEAERALRRSGWEDSGVHAVQLSYDTSVRVSWSQNFGLAAGADIKIPEGLAWRKPGQKIDVTFLALPEGPRVSKVVYWGGEAGFADDAFRAQIAARYGKPVYESPDDLRWCTVKAPSCEDPREATYPLLSVWIGARSVQLIGADPAQAAALAARETADIESRRPAMAPAAF